MPLELELDERFGLDDSFVSYDVHCFIIALRLSYLCRI